MNPRPLSGLLTLAALVLLSSETYAACQARTATAHQQTRGPEKAEASGSCGPALADHNPPLEGALSGCMRKSNKPAIAQVSLSRGARRPEPAYFRSNR
jgi:hypothetical protein